MWWADRLRPLSIGEGGSRPRPVSSQRFKREALADRAKRIAFDDAGVGHGVLDRLSDVGDPHRTPGQEHGVDVISRQTRLCEAVLDANRDSFGELPCVADEI